MKKRLTALFLCLMLLLGSCSAKGDSNTNKNNNEHESGNPSDISDLGDENKSFGEALDDTGAYDGYFEGESVDITVQCISGTSGAYKLEGKTLTFTSIGKESVYSVSGKLCGNIVIDVGDTYKFDLELTGLSLVSSSANPITVLSGDEVAIKAKKDTKNYIYDLRSAIDEADESLHSGAIHSEVDLEIGGKGELTVISENNNGIHTKDDLQLKNLTLLVACTDNCLKGNDSVEIESGTTTLISTHGDCIKTSNSNISEKGNQRGIVTVKGGTHTLYAACDGIDASYDVIIEGDETVVNIFTDKYSNYSQNTASPTSPTDTPRGFIPLSNESYDADAVSLSYSGLKRPSGNGNDPWGRPGGNQGGQMMPGGQGGPGGMGGMGGMGDGNTDKSEGSAKGIKAANEIVINSGKINVKAYDDAIHANNDTTLENGAKPLGNVTVNGGTLSIYSNDDGLHADGTLTVNGGTVGVTNSYEGIEGSFVNLLGGYVSVVAKDDGINAVTASGTGVQVGGGTLYIYCSGDGIDSNSRTSYSGIVFSGGKTVVISTSGGNSAIDTEQGYTYSGGTVVALMPRGGMSNEATHCRNFTEIGQSGQISLSKDQILIAKIGDVTCNLKMPVSLSALLIVLGDSSPSVTASQSTELTLDTNGVCWN